jgi:hypothetical protein
MKLKILLPLIPSAGKVGTLKKVPAGDDDPA